MMFMLGMLLFSSLVMMPLFLQSLLGYTAESAGLVLSGGGFILLFLMPIVGALSGKIPARNLVGFGGFTLSCAMFYSAQRLDLQISFASASLLRVLQVFGLGFLFVPINLSSYVGMPTEKSGSIAGIVNFMRNIGSSVGTSVVTTLLARRAQVHQAYLVRNIAAGRPILSRKPAGLAGHLATSGVGAPNAFLRAYALLYQSLIGQATLLAYVDTFRVLSILAFIMFLLFFKAKESRNMMNA